MTAPPLPPALQELVDRYAAGDRSTMLCLGALARAADERGSLTVNDLAIAYRDFYLRSLRQEGRDADREAGRLSLDEVRGHLSHSVLPRLAAEGAVILPPGGTESPDARLRIPDAIWATVAPLRSSVPALLRHTGEFQTPTSTAAVRPSSHSILEADGLVKMYRRRRVVNDVALRLQQGEIVGLLGPNGAGKTTTFYMIVGLIQPLGGRIVLDGRDITSMPMYRRARQGIGYLSQEPSIFRKLTVEENILAILETLPLSGAERRVRLEKLLDELGIKHLRRSKAYALSGGERRRLEITRALVTEPKFMMLDEPFAGV
ncbi:MAG TPA: LPS export ABC transporter ATP-binding protein, partial [Gemmatimonadaceae bacterium]|nr:LPS export ABC transporter ATP-binding protein [Gemmatimonadaceae bacterium]